MKVLIVGPYSSPIIRRLADNLVSRGLQVRVASHNVESNEMIYNLGKLVDYSSYLNFIKINKIVNDFKPDIVHAHISNHYGLMTLFVKKPVILALWGSDIMLSTYTGSYINKKLLHFINWLALKKSKICHCSAKHISIEAEKQCAGVLNKNKVFFWGFPIPKLDELKRQEVELSLQKEFGIDSDKLVIFPRGLSRIYNPDFVSKIVGRLEECVNPKDIVILRGFSSDGDVRYFQNKVDVSSIIFINRILNEAELSVLYSKSIIHFSVPVSDSLGGGVVEPALYGSFPVLSNLPSYQDYSKKYPAYIIENEKNLDILVEKIKQGEIGKSELNRPIEYDKNNVIKEVVLMYEEVLNG